MSKKQKSIVMPRWEILALQAGRKTQCRRLVKGKNQADLHAPYKKFIRYAEDGQPVVCASKLFAEFIPKLYTGGLPCKYGSMRHPEMLLVKETFAYMSQTEEVEYDPDKWVVEYKADTTNHPYPGGWDEEDARGNPDAPKWLNATQMPQRICRWRLDVLEIRFERLQDITEDDAKAEGVLKPRMAMFENYWDATNMKKGFPFSTNPWVWVLTFAPIRINP
jgi:hypothetical protein